MSKIMSKLYDIVEDMEFISSKDYNFRSKKWFFISGPMRGKKDWNKEAFFDCEEKLYDMCGHDPNIYNPARENIKNIDGDRPFTANMKRTLRQLLSKRDWGRGVYYVDAIVLLPGWDESYGAIVEAIVAWEAGIDLILWEE